MKKLLYIAACLLVALPVFSHPHVLITSRFDVEYHGRSCTGIWIDWEFDEVFSASIIQEFAPKAAGTFSPVDVQRIYKGAFINLKNYNFFTYVRKGAARYQPVTVEQFSAREAKGHLFYRFFLPLAGRGYGEDFSIAIFDPTFYCAVTYPENAVTITRSDGDSPTFELVTNKRYPVYYNPFGSVNDTRTYERWKPGLQTAYPQEVHIHFVRQDP